ncbi:MAG: hypothetical protein KatS3mg115_1418 [Candidatus Poribacteria bacterium]|nr:MAG: hypothetical protein KatS3mg115_1418 [Candidatus Poribacteria bacterium]
MASLLRHRMVFWAGLFALVGWGALAQDAITITSPLAGDYVAVDSSVTLTYDVTTTQSNQGVYLSFAPFGSTIAGETLVASYPTATTLTGEVANFTAPSAFGPFAVYLAVADSTGTVTATDSVSLNAYEPLSVPSSLFVSVAEDGTVYVDIPVTGGSTASPTFDLTISSGPVLGSVTGDGTALAPDAFGNLTVTYDPTEPVPPDVAGSPGTSDVFTVEITESGVPVNTTSVTIDVDIIQKPPTITWTPISGVNAAVEGTSYTITFSLPDVGITHTPSASAGYSVDLADPPLLGTISEAFPVSVATDSASSFALTYTPSLQPDATFEPNDFFILTVTDLEVGVTKSFGVSVEITPTNAAPVVGDLDADPNTPGTVDPFLVPQGGAIQILLTGVASDPDGDLLTYSVPSGTTGAGGTVSVSTNGVLTYTAPGGSTDPFSAAVSDSVTFDVSDGTNTAQGSVFFSIVPVREAAVTLSASPSATVVGLITIGVINTAGLDGLSDLLAPAEPTNPPPEYSLRIVETNEQGLLDSTDYLRNIVVLPTYLGEDGPTVGWTLFVRAGAAAQSLDWVPSEILAIADDLAVSTGTPHYAFLTDVATGETWDMTTVGSVPLDANQTYTFQVGFYPPQIESVWWDIWPGWNAVSLPAGSVNPSDFDALGAYTVSAYRWDALNQTWVSQTLPLGVGSIVPLNEGLFLKADSNGTSAYIDTDVIDPAWRDVTVTLQPGWNLIGSPLSFLDVPILTVTAPLTSQSLIRWDSMTQSYVAVTDYFETGKAYWVYNDTGSLVEVPMIHAFDLSTEGGAFSSLFHGTMIPSPSSLPVLHWVLPLTLETADGQSRQVELGVSDAASVGYDAADIPLPPPPPIRNGARLYAEVDHAVRRLMRSVQPAGTENVWIVNAELPEAGWLRWRLPELPEGTQLLLSANGRTIDMSEESALALGRGRHRIQLTYRFLRPDGTRLLPNYPNPFNPETWIPFQLAEDAAVRLVIYNVSGQAIRTLDLGQRSAGFYTRPGNAAYWDGRNELGEPVSSGVYFYELRAGSHREVRRMVILK